MTNGKRKSARLHPELTVNVMRMHGAWSGSLPGYSGKIEAWCKTALAGKNIKEISIVLTDDKNMRDLNHTYRGKNKPTNVLSFITDETAGDIVLAFETIKREAKAQRKSFWRHTAHLVVHGCLHLAGYDHETDSDADTMESLEATILAQLNIPNPYRVVA